jgi:hypothetical protein
MNKTVVFIAVMPLLLAGSITARAQHLSGSMASASQHQQHEKTYRHASEYQVAILDGNRRIATGADITLGRTGTDAKLDRGGQGFHFLHTDAGDYRVEAPVNKGLSALASRTGSIQVTP